MKVITDFGHILIVNRQVWYRNQVGDYITAKTNWLLRFQPQSIFTLVAWFTVVVEANCVRQPVSLMFPLSGVRKKEETTRKQQGNYLSG